jgi:hypothetical protein
VSPGHDERVPVVVPRRTSVAGDELRLLVLASSPTGCDGIDLASGALVRAIYPERARTPFRPYDIVSAALLGEDELETPYAPEQVQLASVPEVEGQLTGRRAERYLRLAHQPRNGHLLGFPGPAVPFWTLEGDRPSMAVVEPAAGPAVVRTARDLRCRFVWRGLDHELPLVDRGVAAKLDAAGGTRFTGDSLTRLLGARPTRVLIALTPPMGGYCYKAVAALLPHP